MRSKNIRSAKARLIVPLVAMGSSGLAVSITLGVMMRIVNAFFQVRGSRTALMGKDGHHRTALYPQKTYRV
ncbi:hypothetical protein [Campylobacter rectus]